MNLKRLEKVVTDLQDELGDALIATDIWTIDGGQSLAGFNPQPKATALFNEITRNLIKSLKDSEFPGLGNYYLIQLENNFSIVIVIQDNLQEGMLVDLSKTSFGILTYIVIPKVLAGLKEALG